MEELSQNVNKEWGWPCTRDALSRARIYFGQAKTLLWRQRRSPSFGTNSPFLDDTRSFLDSLHPIHQVEGAHDRYLLYHSLALTRIYPRPGFQNIPPPARPPTTQHHSQTSIHLGYWTYNGFRRLRIDMLASISTVMCERRSDQDDSWIAWNWGRLLCAQYRARQHDHFSRCRIVHAYRSTDHDCYHDSARSKQVHSCW